MLKSRIRNIEKKVKPKVPFKKGGKLWYVRVDEIVSDPDSADLKKIEQDLIAKIKNREIQHPSGEFYSEDEHNMFIVVVPTRKPPDGFCDDE